MRNAPLPTRAGARGRNKPAAPPLRSIPLAHGLAEAPAPREDRTHGDREFLPAALEIIETPPPRRRAALGYAICGLIAAGLLWACLGHLRIYAIAPGTIEAAGNTKVVQPRKAGQVVAIRAKNGDRVAQGAVLIELDPTDAVASQTAIADKLASLRAEIARQRAEIAAARSDPVVTDPPIQWDDSVPQQARERETRIAHADLAKLAAGIADLAAQRREKLSAKAKYAASVTAQNALIAVIQPHLAMHETLARKGVESQAIYLEALAKLRDAQRNLATLQGKLATATAEIPVLDAAMQQARADFIAADAETLTAGERQADELTQQLTIARRTVSYMTLRAPVAGIVEASAVTTIGQAVKPGQQLMQLVPDRAPLQIEAYVLNADIGFVKAGQAATIKVDTFPYTRYGTIAGKVLKVGADAIPGGQALLQQKNGSQPVATGALSDTAAAQAVSDLVFPVTIAPAKSTIKVEGRDVALAPGMSVAVEVDTGEQRAIHYILFPLLRAFE